MAVSSPVVLSPFSDRPPPVELANPIGEQLADVVADLERETERLEQVHLNQELRRRVERERQQCSQHVNQEE